MRNACMHILTYTRAYTYQYMHILTVKNYESPKANLTQLFICLYTVLLI